jgi:flavin-dependent dehydrogenase
MIDPFCGEGMRHALDSGMRAARIVAEGFSRRGPYDAMRHRYEEEAALRWTGKRRLGAFLREMLRHPRIASIGLAGGLAKNPAYWFRKLWD